MDDYISRGAATAHPFANGKYDHVHANEDFILGHESYKEWLEDLPAANVRPVVTCENCKFWDRDRISCEGLARCNTGETGIRYRAKYDFCSRGADMRGKDDVGDQE